VFEEVRKTGAALGFEPETDAVTNAYTESRSGVIFGDNDRQPVR